MKRTYETCGKEFTSRKAADRYARNIANASGLQVPVYETTGAKTEPCEDCTHKECATIRRDKRRAQARLNGAAQDLLEALVKMLAAYAPNADWTQPDQLHSAVLAAGRAIEKAKGCKLSTPAVVK